MTSSPHALHANQGAYKHCKHPECLAYRDRYRKRWVLDREHGQKRTIPSAKVKLHIATLIGLGWTQRAIAGAAGVSPQSITRICQGHTTITRKIAVRVMAVDPNSLPQAASRATTEPFVSRVGSTRRIQALLFMGWTHEQLAVRSGVKTAAMLNQAGRWVTRSTHDRIARLYDDLAMTLGPSTRNRGRAIERGYVGPLAWDDIDHDTTPNLGLDDQFAVELMAS